MHGAFFMPKYRKEATVRKFRMVAFYIYTQQNKTYRKERIMKERLEKLLSVKSIVTIAMTIVFCILAIRGTLSGTEFLTIFTVVVGFYFGTQKVKEDKVE